jgi:glycerol-3-phosphate acyltransferase PlsX
MAVASRPRIALDAFGGDDCPDPEIEAAVASARSGIQILLVGDQEILRSKLAKFGDASTLAIEIVHAPDKIVMSDSPGKAIRAKPAASMPTAFDLVKQGKADAVVSAGNSGAMLACGLFKFGRTKGVDRPAIVTTFPTVRGRCCLLDMGANIECRPLHFAQFAVMGALFARSYLPSFGDAAAGITVPRVGVLSNGTEESKGTDLTRSAHSIFKEHRSDDFHYLGYVEGKDIFRGKVDVVVTDGFTGNIALKVAEGTVYAFTDLLRQSVHAGSVLSKLGALLLKPTFRALKLRVDPDVQGGAPLLGVRGTAVICHGAASAIALANGVKMAANLVALDYGPHLADALLRHEALFAGARSTGGAVEVA